MPARVRLSLLEQLPRASLLRLLAPCTSALTHAGVDLVALETPHDNLDHDAPLRALYRALSNDRSGELAGIAAALGDVDALANDAGRDAVLDAYDEVGIARPTHALAPAATALDALLDAPDAFAYARAGATADAVDRYVELESGRPPAVRSWDELAAALAARMASHFSASDRTAYVDALAVDRDHEIILELTHAKRLVDLEHVEGDVRRRAQLRPSKRDYLIIEPSTGRLAVHACSKAELHAYSRALGELLFGDADHYQPRALLALDKLRDGPLDTHEGIAAVHVTRLVVKVGTETLTWAGGAASGGPWRRLRLEGGVVSRARLSLLPEGRKRARTVELSVPAGLTLDRGDRAWEAQVRAFLVARGLMLAPWRAARAEEA